MKKLILSSLLLAALCCQAAPVNLAKGKITTASDCETAYFTADKATDGIINRKVNTGEQSRWGSAVRQDFPRGEWNGDNLWLQVDLGSVVEGLREIDIDWENPKATKYEIRLSSDGIVWRTAWSSGKPSTQQHEVILLGKPETARYVRLQINGFRRDSWGTISVYELSVFNEVLPPTLERFANTFSIKNLSLTGDFLGYVDLPQGVKVRPIASTLEQIVALSGKIRRPISPVTTEMTFEVSKGSKKFLTPAIPVLIAGAFTPAADANAKPEVLPALQEWVGGRGVFVPANPLPIYLENKTHDMIQRAKIFAADYTAQTGKSTVFVDTSAEAEHGIFFRFTQDPLGPEGYRLVVDARHVVIEGTTPQAAFWGTRTFLQVIKKNNGTFPQGLAVDYPRYPVRGFMFDVGRKPVTREFVYDVMKVMSWYKLNDLQLHLNDCFIWLHRYSKSPDGGQATAAQKRQAIADVLAEEPSAGSFRLESTVVGSNGVALTSKDYAYTKEEFGKMIDDSAEYGVRIVPELDVPGHALQLVRVRPDLMYRGHVHKPHDTERAAMLDASSDVFDPATGKTFREETLEFVKSIFAEYLTGDHPVFRNGVVHIGTDEYYGNAEDYRAFTDAMLKYVKSTGHTPRLWGSLRAKDGKTPVIADGVQMHIWSRDWQRPGPAIDMGYDIINILDADMYIVPNGNPRDVRAYGDDISREHLYGKNWQPNIMRQYTVPAGHPQLLGAQFAVWNDNAFYGDPGLQDNDLFERIQKTCAVMAEKTWNDGTDDTYTGFCKKMADVGLPPTLDYSKLIFPAYEATFTLKLTAKPTPETARIFSASTGALLVSPTTGKLAIYQNAWNYTFDYVVPLNEAITIKIVAKDRKVELFVNGQSKGFAKRDLYAHSHRYMNFYFPSRTPCKTFAGEVKDLQIKSLP